VTTKDRFGWLKLTLILVAAGLLVGALVAAVSVATAVPFCGSGVEGDRCRTLVVTLARRAGLVAGAATVLMVLVAAGLARMLTQDDRDRAERAMEAYRESRPAEDEGV
jgi:high-affinity Fe2+/Pb2+ permease